jgi:predicted signal transduction protein with EAL and GGDEF domain
VRRLEARGRAESLAARIDNALSSPFELTNVTITFSASVGMAYAGPGQAITGQLIVDADIAMYQAKRNGGAGHQIIDGRAARSATAGHSLEHDLPTAFAADQLAMAYQPIVQPSERLVTDVEALLGWEHTERGPFPPRT